MPESDSSTTKLTILDPQETAAYLGRNDTRGYAEVEFKRSAIFNAAD